MTSDFPLVSNDPTETGIAQALSSAPASPSQAVAAAPPPGTRPYVVLMEWEPDEDGRENWTHVGIFPAQSNKGAIKLAAQETKMGGTYVATPSRSWTPEKVHVSTEPTISVGS